MGIGAALAGFLLEHYGYQPNVALSDSARQGILLMMSLIPAIPALLACAALYFYELDEPTVARMGQDLAAARGDGKS